MPVNTPMMTESTVATVTSLSVIGIRRASSVGDGLLGGRDQAEVLFEHQSLQPVEVALDRRHVETEGARHFIDHGCTLGRVRDREGERERIAGLGHEQVQDERRAEHHERSSDDPTSDVDEH